MIQLSLVDKDGKAVVPQDLATVGEIHEVSEWAKRLIHECERLMKTKNPKKPGSGVPYM